MAETSVATYTGSLSSHGWYESVSATAVFKTGHQYVGAWKGGKMHGRGTYTYADGEEARRLVSVAARCTPSPRARAMRL